MNQAKLDQELLKAIQYNKLGLVKRLHSEGASVNCRNDEGRSPLHLSIYSDWDSISRFLIDMGADLNAKGKFGGTPLHMAAFKGNLAVVQLMINKSVDLRAKDSNGNLPMHLAAMYGWADIVEVFIKAVVPEGYEVQPLIPQTTNDGEEPEQPAEQPATESEGEAEEDIHPDIRSLIQARNAEGETPLHHAAVNCKKQAIEYLLRLGADPEAKDNQDTQPQLYQPGKPESYFKVPAYVRCMSCAESIKLDGEEQRTGVYFCPYCEQEVDHLNFGKQSKSGGGSLKDKFGGWFSSSEEKSDIQSSAEKPGHEYIPEPIADDDSGTDVETPSEHEEVEMEEKLISETVNCAICRKSLKLDEEEQKRGIYFCPYCNLEVDHIHDAD
ncbi:MAG TPA: ankyrin repeat domain-containing protein [Verrucomicrobiota bacterium]|nr:ankyrin repeat domain-containing protein [Verrucomicrobiota bacterium]